MVVVTVLREVRMYLAAQRANGKEKTGGHNAGMHSSCTWEL